jgi:hypothetical protein
MTGAITKGAAAFFLSGFGLPAEAVDELLGSPAGEAMIDSARALPYDYAVVGDGLLPDDLAAKPLCPPWSWRPELRSRPRQRSWTSCHAQRFGA